MHGQCWDLGVCLAPMRSWLEHGSCPNEMLLCSNCTHYFLWPGSEEWGCNTLLYSIIDDWIRMIVYVRGRGSRSKLIYPKKKNYLVLSLFMWVSSKSLRVKGGKKIIFLRRAQVTIGSNTVLSYGYAYVNHVNVLPHLCSCVVKTMVVLHSTGIDWVVLYL